MKRVYIAGPVGAVEGRLRRVHAAIEVAHELAELGFAPFVPHLFHYWNEMYGRSYEQWMDFCMLWLQQCDCVLRMPGESPGADREVAFARELSIPVFTTLEELATSW